MSAALVDLVISYSYYCSLFSISSSRKKDMNKLTIHVTTPASQIMPRPGMKKPRSQEPRRAIVLLCLRRQLAPCGAFLLASVKLPCTATYPEMCSSRI